MARVQITPSLFIDDSEIEEHFVQASGPGGQNVNKVATAVQLRFDAKNAPSLDDDMRARLNRLAGRRMSKDGVLVISAQRFRSQERNRADARTRLFELLAKAAAIPAPRKKTRPSLGAKRKRLDEKNARSRVKRLRTRPTED